MPIVEESLDQGFTPLFPPVRIPIGGVPCLEAGQYLLGTRNSIRPCRYKFEILAESYKAFRVNAVLWLLGRLTLKVDYTVSSPPSRNPLSKKRQYLISARFSPVQ
jgi:hypothetical protein